MSGRTFYDSRFLIALRPLDNPHAVTPFLLGSDGAAAGFPSM